jgi:hypothetical protein
MVLIAQNNQSVWINDGGVEYTEIKFDLSFLFFNELMVLLKIRTNETFIHPFKSAIILVENQLDAVEMDDILIRQIQPRQLLASHHLISYYILLQLLGVEFNWSNILLKYGKKNQLIYSSASFDVIDFDRNEMKHNELTRYLQKGFTNKELEQGIERFFILFDEGLKQKLSTTISFYRTKFKIDIEMNIFLDKLFNSKRLIDLKSHLSKVYI